MSSVVYRAFDADNQLLYVGVTANPGSRFNIHEYQTRWWHLVDRVELSQEFENRQDAEDAERVAISKYQPSRNKHFPVVPEHLKSSKLLELQFSPYDYKPEANWPAVWRSITGAS